MSAPPDAAAQPRPTLDPPRATVHPQVLEAHGHTRVDDYFWLRERDNPEVIAYLEAENAYTEAMTAHIEGLSETLFEEMKGRIKQDDQSVPYRKGDYFYYARYAEGQEYPIYARRRGALDGPEEVLLDVNRLAEEAGTDFYQVGGVEVSPDHRRLVFAADTMGRRIYTLHVRDIATGETVGEPIGGVTANVAWANDNETVFYLKKDPVTLRAFQVYRHRLGTDPAGDALVFEEEDEEFYTYVTRSKSDRYVFIVSSQTVTSEVRYVDADAPADVPRMLLPRERGHEYRAEHFGDHFYLRSNADGASNFKLMRTPVADPGRDTWEEVVPHRGDTYLADFEIVRDYLVLYERRDALTHLRVRPWDGGAEHLIAFDEPAYFVGLGTNVEFDTSVLRFVYTSMTTPATTYDYDLATRERTLLKREEVLGGFDPADYVTERLWAEARDGVRVPISLVYRQGTPVDGTAPLLLYGYGSYGSSMDASFASTRLSLLDRGFIYAIAHVRGGQEMGRAWYEDGKLLRKKNTFTDFIDAGDFLVAERYADPDRLYAMGGSAGGLLMGAVVNLRPDLFKGIVAAVPFVDIVTTMLDASIPLTTFEYDEWGNPNEKVYYDYMLSYSPYDNVAAQDYPAMLVTTGLHDSQVQYWEPAKWVAKLRTVKTGDQPLLLKTNMDAGHGGASGRFRRLQERAFDYAFLLDLAGTHQR